MDTVGYTSSNQNKTKRRIKTFLPIIVFIFCIFCILLLGMRKNKQVESLYNGDINVLPDGIQVIESGVYNNTLWAQLSNETDNEMPFTVIGYLKDVNGVESKAELAAVDITQMFCLQPKAQGYYVTGLDGEFNKDIKVGFEVKSSEKKEVYKQTELSYKNPWFTFVQGNVEFVCTPTKYYRYGLKVPETQWFSAYGEVINKKGDIVGFVKDVSFMENADISTKFTDNAQYPYVINDKSISFKVFLITDFELSDIDREKTEIVVY